MINEERIINIDEVFNEYTSEEYISNLKEIIEVIKEPHKRKEEFVLVVKEAQYEMTLGQLIATFIFAYPYKKFGFAIGNTAIVTEELNKGTLNSKLSNIITELYEEVEVKDLNDSIATVLQLIAYTSTTIPVVSGISTSIKSLFELADENPRVWELLNWDIPDGLQFNEIEKLVNERATELFDIIRNSDNEYGQLLRANSVINLDQFKQAVLNISLKPDLFGRVIPEPINTSFLRGFTNYTDVFINAIGARKALINNFYYVKKSGSDSLTYK